SCSSASMSGSTARNPWHTPRIDLSQRDTRGGRRAALFALPFSDKGRRGRRTMNDTPPTLTESALRGIACRCPRCGKGKLYAGFLNLRPSCESCGLDYAFIDTGDGPAVFLIMIAG